MANIIQKIIEIDTIAQQKLNDANQIQEEIKKSVAVKNEQTNSLIKEKAEARVVLLTEIESQYALEKIHSIQAESSEKIKQLELAYAKRHEEIEQELFDAIVNQK